jgi:hypothetical protein
VTDTEPRRIRKLPKNPFPNVPAGFSRRGAITTQQVEETPPAEAPKRPPTKYLRYALTKPRSIEGYVTLTQLASERGIQAQLARIWMKRAKVQQPDAGWRWKDGSRELKKVRKVLGLG